MPTFLVTSKMSPELAARVRASVSGRRPDRLSPRVRPGRVAAVRLVVVASILGLSLWLWSSHREQEREFEAARSALSKRWEGERLAFGQLARDREEQIRERLRVEAGAYAGDVVTPEFQANAAEISKRPALYVRLAQRDALDPESLLRASGESGKDAFLSCFVAPPATLEEKALLVRVRAIYGGEALRQPELARFERVHDVFFTSSYSSDAWKRRIEGAETEREVLRLERLLRDAHLERTRDAARASLLVALLDEPKEAGAPLEIDGAHRHHARVVVVDLESARVFFRARRLLDPAWISEATRVRYAVGLDACRLGRELR